MSALTTRFPIVITLAGALLAGTTPAAADGWQTAGIIDAGASDAYQPRVAASAGKAVTVWGLSDGTLYANRWDGAAWSGATAINGTVGAFEPQIAIDGSGNAMAVWQDSGLMLKPVAAMAMLPGVTAAPTNHIYASRWDGTAWSTPEVVDVGMTDSTMPQVAFDGNGAAVVVWVQAGPFLPPPAPTSFNIYARRWTGSSWSKVELMNSGLSGNWAGSPQVVANASGQAMVVFQQNDPYPHIYANYWNGTAWSGATPLDSAADVLDINPRVAMDDSGHAVTAWLRADMTTGIHLNFSRWNGSAWSAAESIDAGCTINGMNGVHEIAMNASGKAVAVWEGEDAVSSNIRACATTFNGTTWSTTATIDTDSGSVSGAQVAMDEAGHAVATWTAWDGTSARTYGNRWDGTTWTGEATIDDGTPGGTEGFVPDIAMDAAGNAVAVWAANVGKENRIYANGYVVAAPASESADGGGGAFGTPLLLMLAGLSVFARRRALR